MVKYKQGHFKEAFQNLERAVEIFKKISQNETSDERLVLALYMMGKCQVNIVFFISVKFCTVPTNFC